MTSSTLLIGSYNPYFVSLSIVVAIIASAASLDVADRIGRSEGWLRGVWTAASGVAMGGGIWAMHFIAILALLLPVPVAYDVPTTLGSLALSITVTGVAFAIVCGGTYSVRRLAIGGLIMGLGVAGMHYTGMDAMRLPAMITYDPFLFLASVAIAVVAATAALWIAVRVTGFAWRLAAALVMGLAVASMHFTGMAATCFSGRASAIPLEHGLDRGSLALAVAAGALVILSLELVSAAVDRRFAQLRQQETDESRRAQDLAEAALVELRATQRSLIQAEKMASLSGLTAGIAHEINTPIGTALTATTTLQRRTDEFVESVRTGKVTKSAALKYAEVASESSALIVSNIRRAATLIQSFKQVAVDQTSGECREFELAEYLLEIVHSLTPRLKQTPHTIDISCPPGIVITSYPGALAQVITNLIMNSLVHAFPDAYAGVITLVARPYQDDMVELIYGDNGVGIPDSDRARVFDPFFTTRRAEGGTGLGLHIVYNIVTQTLMGTITLETRPGKTCFEMLLPVNAERPVEMVNTL
jgi:NO-binding membrane sensor protein with MHYT domain/nitrogen-specific signal transduction histidine kinase